MYDRLISLVHRNASPPVLLKAVAEAHQTNLIRCTFSTKNWRDSDAITPNIDLCWKSLPHLHQGWRSPSQFTRGHRALKEIIPLVNMVVHLYLTERLRSAKDDSPQREWYISKMKWWMSSSWLMEQLSARTEVQTRTHLHQCATPLGQHESESPLNIHRHNVWQHGRSHEAVLYPKSYHPSPLTASHLGDHLVAPSWQVPHVIQKATGQYVHRQAPYSSQA